MHVSREWRIPGGGGGGGGGVGGGEGLNKVLYGEALSQGSAP